MENRVVKLLPREREHVKIYWEKTQDDEIRTMFPMMTDSLDKALSLFEQASQPGAASYGRIIAVSPPQDQSAEYVGDVWCYCIDEKVEKSAMLSILIFEKACWHKGIGQAAIKLFIDEMFEKYQINTIGAFTFADNLASIHALEKSGFCKIEEFAEDGRLSVYLEYKK